jgi:hypothetical protein
MLCHWPRLQLRVLLSLGLLFAMSAGGVAAPPWAQLIPFRGQAAPVRTAAATNDEDYSLTEKEGPWMIMAASFISKSDDDRVAGEEQALALVKELRTKHRMKAYIFRQEFDFTQPEVGLGFNKYGGPKMMRNWSGERFEEIAVMVGNFESVHDPDLEETLKTIKNLRPVCMSKPVDPQQQQKDFVTKHISARVSEFYRNTFLPKDDSRRQRGPLGRAFVTRNPLLPDELFVSKGLDPFVVDMNKNLPYSLLKNPKKYTVKVATFRGVSSMKPREFEEKLRANGGQAQIDVAAEKASQLCAALRKQGVEAYEFHDISESIVTIGSFDTVGTERPDGKLELHPAIFQIMEKYKAEQKPIPGYSDLAVVPKQLAGINFDTQPIPVEVPRQSMAANYNATNGIFR